TVIITQIYGTMVARVHATLAFFPVLPVCPLLVYVNLFLLMAGTAIGAAGSMVSLRKFLKV
ncbi:MAG: ABC transporter permease, partial [Acidaminococcaceae bacterium]